MQPHNILQKKACNNQTYDKTKNKMALKKTLINFNRKTVIQAAQTCTLQGRAYHPIVAHTHCQSTSLYYKTTFTPDRGSAT